MNEWTPDWPTEPGWYWFYGQPYVNAKPRLTVVKAHEAVNSIACECVCEGALLYKSEGADGRWQRMTTPEIPAKEGVK